MNPEASNSTSMLGTLLQSSAFTEDVEKKYRIRVRHTITPGWSRPLKKDPIHILLESSRHACAGLTIWVELAEDGNIVKNYNKISIGGDGFGTAFSQFRCISLRRVRFPTLMASMLDKLSWHSMLTR